VRQLRDPQLDIRAATIALSLTVALGSVVRVTERGCKPGRKRGESDSVRLGCGQPGCGA
jgi:hypothetical protein